MGRLILLNVTRYKLIPVTPEIASKFIKIDREKLVIRAKRRRGVVHEQLDDFRRLNRLLA